MLLVDVIWACPLRGFGKGELVKDENRELYSWTRYELLMGVYLCAFPLVVRPCSQYESRERKCMLRASSLRARRRMVVDTYGDEGSFPLIASIHVCCWMKREAERLHDM